MLHKGGTTVLHKARAKEMAKSLDDMSKIIDLMVKGISDEEVQEREPYALYCFLSRIKRDIDDAKNTAAWLSHGNMGA